MPPDLRLRRQEYWIPDQLGLLRPQSSRWRSFTGGFLVQLVMCTILVNIAFYEFVKEPLEQKYDVTEIYAPSLPVEPVTPKIRAYIPPPPVEHVIPPRPRLTAPEIRRPLPEVTIAQRLQIPQAEPDVALPKVIPRLKPEPRLNQFPGSSAKPTLSMPAAKVQTGGFGDPNGIAANPNAHGAVAIAQVGAFELPAGPGWGNGTGGTHGARGAVVSAGFGNGTAVPAVQPGTRGGGVREGSFGNAAAAAAPARSKPAEQPRPSLVPVTVLSKPQPSYTAEARQKRIEGEVLLDVVFGADGQIRVLRVVRGLGSGLDESAIRAAQGISFKPATREGQPVDSTARIHITFQLT